MYLSPFKICIKLIGDAREEVYFHMDLGVVIDQSLSHSHISVDLLLGRHHINCNHH